MPPRVHSAVSVAGSVAVVVAALALASRVAIPVGPVPITLQTLVVTLLGALCGPRVAVTAILIWLCAGLAGLPVLAGGGSGWGKLFGPTGGYLIAFPLAGALVGWLAAARLDAALRSGAGSDAGR